ncbi:hypothetical protein CC78DRAFT_578060 [Lojkania enalia]|uniref:Uncharacterized protein n=1 Tax=Lojkania enalia TaxID=147567 RepID=A0A9P4N7L2_9PLEO|nr:hypothetical protein CC78DRAFT_578060 [Didymosphaeria enalia]
MCSRCKVAKHCKVDRQRANWTLHKECKNVPAGKCIALYIDNHATLLYEARKIKIYSVGADAQDAEKPHFVWTRDRRDAREYLWFAKHNKLPMWSQVLVTPMAIVNKFIGLIKPDPDAIKLFATVIGITVFKTVGNDERRR